MMTTRCPNCATAFRVSPEQLKAMHGKVRCGQCQQVFNAIDSLCDMASEPVAAPGLPEEELPEAEIPEGEPALIEDSSGYQAERQQVSAESDSLPTVDIDQPAQQIEPLLHEEADATPQRHAWVWISFIVLAMLLLSLQIIVHFRVELSVLLPGSKPLLEALCKPLDCELPLPRKGDLIGIESSDLRPDSKNQGQLVLAATLKNRAPFAQAYPHLELTLTDLADQPILRKVLAPADYLPKGSDIASGFATHGEISVDLALTHDLAGNAPATGYRLYLFYP